MSLISYELDLAEALVGNCKDPCSETSRSISSQYQDTLKSDATHRAESKAIQRLEWTRHELCVKEAC